MTPLEIALIILISVWTLVVIILAIAIIIIFIRVKRALDKAQEILQKTEGIADEVRVPLKMVLATILGVVGKSTLTSLLTLIGKKIIKK